MLEVDEAVLAHLEADGMRLPVEGVVHLVAREESAHHLHVRDMRAIRRDRNLVNLLDRGKGIQRGCDAILRERELGLSVAPEGGAA